MMAECKRQQSLASLASSSSSSSSSRRSKQEQHDAKAERAGKLTLTDTICKLLDQLEGKAAEKKVGCSSTNNTTTPLDFV
jgi:hypothetical protein